MNSNEWPLVFFTLLSQVSVGMVACMLILAASFRDRSLRAITPVYKAIILTALVFMSVALLISFLHLTQPLHAVYALQGLKTSWLSREILLASLYLALLMISFVAYRFRILSGRQQLLMLFSATALTGLLLIYAMARLYMLPTIPAWNNLSTPVSFFNTALLTGSAITLAYTALFFPRGMEPQAFAKTAKILAVMVCAGIIIHAVNGMLLTPSEAITRDDVIFLPELVPAIWKLARWGFLVIGSASLAVWLLRFKSPPSIVGLFLVCLAADCFLLAEVCARYLFYASYFRLGV